MGRAIKRALDIFVALILLVLLAPVTGLLWLAVRVTIGSPVIFKQRRPGLHGRVFEVLKFRTMTDARDENGYPLPDKERQTFLGLLLRCTSLDELPQLINILKGEMSFVGPRPLLAHYVANCKDEHLHRYDVPAGITGWAQVHGRQTLDYEKRFEYDVWYIENWSLILDFKIVAKTALMILKREGVVEMGKPVVGADITGNILPPDQADSMPWVDGNREVVTQMIYEQKILFRYQQMLAQENGEVAASDRSKANPKTLLG